MIKTLTFPEALHPLLANYIELDRESVAFIVGDADTGRVRGLWGVENRFEARKDRGPDMGFAIGKQAWQDTRDEAARQGVSILGVLHSHLYDIPWPSFMDYRALTKSAPWGVVYHPRAGLMITFTKNDAGKGCITAVHNLELGPVQEALAYMTIREGDSRVDRQGIDYNSAGTIVVPDTPELIQYARDWLKILDAPGADLPDVDPRRVEDLKAAVAAVAAADAGASPEPVAAHG